MTISNQELALLFFRALNSRDFSEVTIFHLDHEKITFISDYLKDTSFVK